MSGQIPFKWHKTDAKIMRAISDGELPYEVESIISRHCLDFLVLSWVVDPVRRPTILDICHILGIMG
jgi:hypothetical protein